MTHTIRDLLAVAPKRSWTPSTAAIKCAPTQDSAGAGRADTILVPPAYPFHRRNQYDTGYDSYTAEPDDNEILAADCLETIKAIVDAIDDS